jgi:hypothetical protein
MFIKSIDKYHIRAIPCALIVSRHARPFALASPRNFCPLRVSVYPERTRRALDSPFSFVFLNLQHSTLDFQPSALSNSFPHNSLSDPHPLNPVVSILYKNSGGGAPAFLSSRAKRGICFSLLRCFFTSLLQSSERFKSCPLNPAIPSAPPSIPTASTSALKASAATC